jgi:hypothetical protein
MDFRPAVAPERRRTLVSRRASQALPVLWKVRPAINGIARFRFSGRAIRTLVLHGKLKRILLAGTVGYTAFTSVQTVMERTVFSIRSTGEIT